MKAAILLVTLLAWAAGDSQKQGSAGRSTGAHRRLHLQLVRSSDITAAEIEAALDQVRRIWLIEGVDIQLIGGDRDTQGAALRLELTDAAIGRAPADGFCALGETRFIDGVPQPRLTVSVSAVRQFVRQARPTQSPGLQRLEGARIVGRVAAHEIGHYLLGDRRHRATGLMRPRFDGADLFAPRLEPFAPPSRHQLTAGFARLGGDTAW